MLCCHSNICKSALKLHTILRYVVHRPSNEQLVLSQLVDGDWKAFVYGSCWPCVSHPCIYEYLSIRFTWLLLRPVLVKPVVFVCFLSTIIEFITAPWAGLCSSSLCYRNQHLFQHYLHLSRAFSSCNIFVFSLWKHTNSTCFSSSAVSVPLHLCYNPLPQPWLC